MVVFDVDGVLVASPHERVWREALQGIADPARFTNSIYQAHVAGKPRLSGARAALEVLGVSDADTQAAIYAARKQQRIEELIRAGSSPPSPTHPASPKRSARWGFDWPSRPSSKNANGMM